MLRVERDIETGSAACAVKNSDRRARSDEVKNGYLYINLIMPLNAAGVKGGFGSLLNVEKIHLFSVPERHTIRVSDESLLIFKYQYLSCSPAHIGHGEVTSQKRAPLRSEISNEGGCKKTIVLSKGVSAVPNLCI